MKESFGQRVRRIRQERKWSQQELSLRSGISTPHISSIERGRRFPSLEYARKVADALGVGLIALCNEDIEVRPPKMHRSPGELPLYLQNFVLNEDAEPYLHAAHEMSTLPQPDAELLRLVIELVSQSRKENAPPE